MWRVSRSLIPSPFDSAEAEARFRHRDLADLSAAQLWAELTTIEAALADRLARRVRPQVMTVWPAWVDEHHWLLERIRQLRRERQRRRCHVR